MQQYVSPQLLSALLLGGALCFFLACTQEPELGGAGIQSEQAQISLRLPESSRTLIALTYDDGLYTQRTQAAPQLDSVGLVGTFFLNAVEGRNAVLDWYRIGQAGHELANHSLFHPCPESFGWPEHLSTEAYDTTRFISELATQHQLIANIEGDDTGPRSYAHPCNYHFIDAPEVSTLPLLESSPLVTYGRTGGDRNAVLLPNTPYERLAVPSWTVTEGATAAELIAFAEQAHQVGGGAVYTFHGIGADWIVVTREAHMQLLTHLAANQDRFEVVTFADLAKRMLPPVEEPLPGHEEAWFSVSYD